MHSSKQSNRLVVVLCCLAVGWPRPAVADAARDVVGERADRSPGAAANIVSPFDADGLGLVKDVALGSQGRLDGQLVTASGIPLAGRPVHLRQDSLDVAITTTDIRGFFSVDGLEGGSYQLVAGDLVSPLRLWAPGTAPPVARDGALIVLATRVLRGQDPSCGGCGACGTCGVDCPGPVRRLLHSPWVIATLIGAAIAVPIAVSNGDDDPIGS